MKSWSHHVIVFFINAKLIPWLNKQNSTSVSSLNVHKNAQLFIYHPTTVRYSHLYEFVDFVVFSKLQA